MDVQQLEAFYWVARTGSFNRAAARLYLTQPSVTHRMQTLEREVGQRLFERRPRGVRMTEAGRTLLPYAERVLQGMRRARQALADLASASGGTLSIGCTPAVATDPLPAMLARFRQRHPGVEINVRSHGPAELLPLILEDAVHFGLMHTPVQPHPDLEQVVLHEDVVVPIIHPAHPLAGLEAVTPERLVREPFVAYDRPGPLWTLIERCWAQAGLVPRVVMDLQGLEAAKSMVRHGLGLTMAPRTAVEPEIRAGHLRLVRVTPANLPRRQILLTQRRGRGRVAVAAAFLAVLAERDRVPTAPDAAPAMPAPTPVRVPAVAGP